MVFGKENILFSAATTDKELMLLNIEYEKKKFRIVDHAIFKLPFQAGLTALGRLQNGNYQVLWTAQDASKKIKIHSMIFDANLNKIGNIKKFAPVLSSHFNLNIVRSGPQSLKAAKDIDTPFVSLERNGAVVLAGYNANGSLGLPYNILNSPPPVFRTIDTAITDFQELTSGPYYANLGVIDSRGDYALLLGDINNENYTKAYVFNGDVLSLDILAVPGTDNFSLFGWEKLNNPVRYKLWERVFDGPTGLPDGPQRNIHTTKPGDLGSLASFNGITAVQSSNSKVRFAWWGAEEPGLNGTSVFAASLDPESNEKIIQNLNFDMIGSPNYVRFVYGMDSTNLSE
jgi:hypothetical protein